MKIGGIQRFSILDYPKQISCVVFCQGCCLKCQYCHNRELQKFVGHELLSEKDLYVFLDSRAELIDAIVFSGGEPLCQIDLKEVMFHVKHQYGRLNGLHTSGVEPSKLLDVLPMLDWVGLDIKTCPDRYEFVTGNPDAGRNAYKSLSILANAEVDFEVRTTYDNRIITESDLLYVANILFEHGVKKWIIQECVLGSKGGRRVGLSMPTVDILAAISKYVEVEIRKQ